jgi:CPA2 family monovalent cation:H+ antiporter-2
VEILGQLGIVFLLFFLGTEFHLRKLKALGPAPLLAGGVELILMFGIGFEVARMMGLRHTYALVFGAMLCMCSTTILVKNLADQKMMKEDFAGFVVGLTLVEDTGAVLILILLNGWASGVSADWTTAVGALARVTAFSAGVLAIGLGAVPRLLRKLEKFQNAEVLALSAVGFGVVLAAMAGNLGFSTALGAFLAGMILADSGVMPKLQERLASLRDLFVALFFITVGFQADFTTLEKGWPWALAAVILVVGVKVLTVTFSALLIGLDARVSLRSGLAMAHVGEFSFVVAALGVSSGIAPRAFSSVVAVAAVVSLIPLPSSCAAPKTGRRPSTEPLGQGTHPVGPLPKLAQGAPFPLARLHTPQIPLSPRPAGPGPGHPPGRAGPHPALVAGFPLPPRRFGHWTMEVLFVVVFLGLYLLLLNALQRIFRHALKSSGETMDRKGQTLLTLWMFVVAVGLAAVFLVEAAPFVSAWTLLLIFLGVGIYLGGGLTKALALMDSRLDNFVDELMHSVEGAAPGDRANLKTLLQDRYPLSAVTMDFMLPPELTAANRTLAELKLRKVTGATVLSVYRGENSYSNPSPDFPLLPGDVLCLLGEKEHVKTAFAYLNELCRKPPETRSETPTPDLEALPVAEVSAVLGRTLRDLGLRNRVGATVVGWEREGKLSTSPSPDEPLKAGDVLLVIGPPEGIRQMRRLLSGREEVPALDTVEEQASEAVLRG